MTLEHAEISQKTPVFSAQSLALVNALWHEEKRDGECVNTQTAPDPNEPKKEVS